MERVLPRSTRAFVLLVFALTIPSAVYAQATIAGVVTDTSGIALPGVTVQARRAGVRQTTEVVTDFKGRYKIVNLKPGIYTIRFTLTGFEFLRREVVTVGRDTTTVDAVASLDANCADSRARPCGAVIVHGDPPDEGCGSVPKGVTCVTYKQVAVDVPQAFRSL